MLTYADSVDMLSDRDTNVDLWLPSIFPSTIRVVVSSEDGEFANQRLNLYVREPTPQPQTRAPLCY